MAECFNCGVSFSNIRLFDAVSEEGIVKVCEKCAREEHIPLIKRPTTFQLKESEKDKTFHDRVSEFKKGTQNRRHPQKEEITLREIVDRNYEDRVGKVKDFRPRPDLIENFHWVIMRARRMKKLTQEQLAKELHESLSAIKMAEQGILPEDDYRLVNKLESFLGIRIVREEFLDVVKPKKEYFAFDRHEARNWTIEDIKNMRKKELEIAKKANEGFSEPLDEEIENISSEEIEFDDSEDELSKEEMDRIIFGR